MLASVVAAASGLAIGSHSAQQPPAGVHVDRDVWVPMRDGVRLQAEVWRPAGEGRFPTLVYRTPYGRKGAQEGYGIFAKAVARGYAVVIQDVRGRYGSEGEFLPYQQEGKDGFDTIEWAATQSWSNGDVGTFGLSYPGAVQWLAAMESPPHLRAMVPAMTFSTPSNFFYSGGVFDLSWIGWIWNNIAPDVRARKDLPGPRTGEAARAEYARLREKFLDHLPLDSLSELKDVAPWYFEWMRHPPRDPWWDWAELRDKYKRARNVAVLNFSGWNDEAYGPEGATTNFAGLVSARRGQRDLRARLIMGPWVHGVPGPDDRIAGERDFGPASVIDYDAMVLDWMDRYVKDVPCGSAQLSHASLACGAPVRYFVMGANQWRDSAVWPLDDTYKTTWYLTGTSTGQKTGGLAAQPPRGQQRSSFVSDAANPVPDPFPPYTGGHDYSVLASRTDVLFFDSEPFPRDTEVTGPIQATIYLSTDAPDTDLWVRLLDLAPDGKALNLMSPGLDVLRASYRHGGPQRELLDSGKPYALQLDNLVTSNLFRKGHRLRVQISATFFPNFSRNLHTGELEMTSSQMRTARIRIHHDRRHPSRIVFPIVPRR
jgi:hypothetical protein